MTILVVILTVLAGLYLYIANQIDIETLDDIYDQHNPRISTDFKRKSDLEPYTYEE